MLLGTQTGQQRAAPRTPYTSTSAAVRTAHEMVRVTLSLEAPPWGLPHEPRTLCRSWYGDFSELGPFCSLENTIFKVSTCYLPPFYRLEHVPNCSHTQPARLTLPKASRPTSFLSVIRLRHSEWLMAVYSSQ